MWKPKFWYENTLGALAIYYCRDHHQPDPPARYLITSTKTEDYNGIVKNVVDSGVATRYGH